ncbi:MAG: acetyl-CoA acyltransferase [Kiritimatiellia bacterium]|jgi:acetyl-CoA acyltransferase
MSLHRRAFVLGGHITPFIGKKHPDFIWKRHPDFGTRTNPTLEDYITAAVRGALDSTGTPASMIDKAWIGNFVGELFSSQGHLGAALIGADPGLLHKPSMRVEGACASGGLAFASALESLQAGADINLVVGAEVQTTASARMGGDYLARASHYARQRGLDDFTFPALFAWRTKHYMAKFGVTEEDIGHFAVKAYANANRNPLAHMKAVKVSLEQARTAGDRNPNFLSNEDLQPYLKVTDCSQVSDGGAAMIVVSEEGLRKLGKTEADVIEIMGIAHTTGNLYTDGDPTTMEATIAAAGQLYASTGLTPNDVQIAEVHDCFTVTEALMYEALGFAEPGRGTDLVKDGATHIDGRLPVNTGGGLVGFGHPVGATGVKQVLEIYRQMKGLCGDYQVSSGPDIGLTANMGGNDKTVVATMLRNCG